MREKRMTKSISQEEISKRRQLIDEYDEDNLDE